MVEFECLLTSVQWGEPVQCCIVLLNGLPEVVSSEGVLAELVVHTGNVVEVKGTETLSCISDNGRFGCRPQHLQGLAVVQTKILHISLEKLRTRRLCAECETVFTTYSAQPMHDILSTAHACDILSTAHACVVTHISSSADEALQLLLAGLDVPV